MPGRTFYTATDGATVTFDFDQSANWQVTLGGNRALTLAGGQEGDQVNILLIQDSSGSRVPSWPANVTFAAGQSPNLTTAPGGSDLISLVKRGSTWQDASGAPNKLPARIGVAALAAMLLVSVGVNVKLSAGAGTPSEIGAVANVRTVQVGTGSNATTTIVENGSGGILYSASGSGLAVGVPNLKSTSRITSGNFYVKPSGLTVSHSTFSGSQVTVNSGTATGKLIIQGGGGVICLPNSSGVQKAIYINNATLTVRSPVGSDCTQ